MGTVLPKYMILLFRSFNTTQRCTVLTRFPLRVLVIIGIHVV